MRAAFVKKIIAIVLALSVIGAGIGFVLVSGDDDSTNQSVNQQDEASTAQNQAVVSGQSDIIALLENGSDLDCELNYTGDNEALSNGRLLISDNRIRGSFSGVQEGEQVNIELLSNENSFYTWDEQTKQGFEIEGTFQDIAEDSDSESQVSSGIDADQQYDVDCQSWNADESVFDKPADVEFTSFGDIFNQLNTSS